MTLGQSHSGSGDNIGRDKVSNHVAFKSQLRVTVNKIFRLTSNISSNPIGMPVSPSDKIDKNTLSDKWKNIIEASAAHYNSIEESCTPTDESYYNFNSLITLLKQKYQDFKDDYISQRITGDQVLEGMVNFYLTWFRENNQAEAHDTTALQTIIAVGFIECGILEK